MALTLSACGEITNTKTEEVKVEDVKVEGVQEEIIVGEAGNMKKYTSEKGYSINIPVEAWLTNCENLPGSLTAPIIVLSDAKVDYIAREYTYVQGVDGACNQVATTLEGLKKTEPVAWKIVIEKAESEKDVEAFIKREFGQACELGQVLEANENGIQDVDVLGTGPDVPENEMCFINWITVVKYDPIAKKLAKWDIGQDANFWGTGTGHNEVFDFEMAKSFKFEK